MKRRWRVVTISVDGTEGGEIGRTFTRWGATHVEARHRKIGRGMYGVRGPTGILEPLPGKPLYSIRIEPIR